MNGRIYDALLGRFLSADIVVQAPGNLQSYNRYSYVMNNPLTLVDPSGFTAWEKTQGLVGGFLEGNGVPDLLNPFSSSPAEAPDVTRGRVTGNAIAAIQGIAEVDGGLAASGGGTVVAVGSGGVLSEVGVPVAAGGVIVAAHGAAVTANAIGHLSTNLERVKQNEVRTGSDKGKVDSKTAPPTEAKNQEPHGNSKSSDKPQHRYEITHNETGDVVKTGISGQELNANGTSPRANPQVSALNKAEGAGTYSAKVVETNIPGRQAGLQNESAATNKLAEQGNSLRLQQRPKPQPKPAKPGEPPPPPDGN